jgi:transcriptional regulator with XRE-family HTH domain
VTAKVAPVRTPVTCPSCGWSTVGRTPGLARGALARHSCARHTAITAASTRGQARDAAIDRTPKPCHHPRANHQHGTRAAYTLDRCRCLPCADARSQYTTSTERAKAYGTWDNQVPAGPVRAHVVALRAAGLGTRSIAAAAGVSRTALAKLLAGTATRGPSTMVTKTVAAALLGVPLPDLAGPPAPILPAATRVDPTGTTRRLQALIAAGWSVAGLSAMYGINRQAMDRALAGAPVLARTARAVTAMYDQIGDTTPPADTPARLAAVNRSRALAAAHKWVIPAMWDEEDLDDPYAPSPSPDPHKGPRADVDEWAHLVRGGEQPERAAARLGVTVDGIHRAATRDDRPDILHLLAQVA